MRTWYRTATAAAGVAALILIGVGSSGAAPGTLAPMAAPTTPAATALAAPTFQPTSELTFVSITPCRIVDTRIAPGASGTPLGNGVTRIYRVGGTTGFVPQGGKSGGCGVPIGAVSITATLTAANPSHSGYMRAWANGQSEPKATLMTYATDMISTGTTVAINPTLAQSLKVKNYRGPSDLIIEVTGYFMKPMAVMVSSSGSLYSGSSRAVSASRTAIGHYEVVFDRNILYCAAVATVYVSSYYASTTTYDGSDPKSVRVSLFNAAGASVDEYFYLQVAC